VPATEQWKDPDHGALADPDAFGIASLEEGEIVWVFEEGIVRIRLADVVWWTRDDSADALISKRKCLTVPLENHGVRFICGLRRNSATIRLAMVSIRESWCRTRRGETVIRGPLVRAAFTSSPRAFKILRR